MELSPLFITLKTSVLATITFSAQMIRWEVDKDFWREVSADKIYLRIPAEKIILLNG